MKGRREFLAGKNREPEGISKNRLDGPENKNLRKRVWVRGQNNLHSIFLTQLPSKF